ncbi:homoserine dehydrogenase [Rhodocytophaga rosea]|uniref:Homoserine dehydrogenase n=1 Tax=Rhodocytophaga rosea TaxID=2704465 RepID=A0A6C0GPW4_9BACT|nr:homoserine dehydrogenase [Rhodocytophaga rosea]QHT70099.1 homoserine dehydrogenase [Rhodocytophaga rosea]
MNRSLKIGMFGFGCVGQGLYDILENNEGFRAELVKICVKDRTKPRKLPSRYFTFDKEDILENPEINLVVELINDADEAYHIVTTALKKGKIVVTANKKMLAEHLAELVALQEQYDTALLYEASACGSIPIIRNLEEYYDNELLFAVSGIMNGSSNYILSKIFNENLSYHTALKQAQDLGFAETDPTLDVGGFDALNKLCILAVHAYGTLIRPEDAFNYGIQSLSVHDIQFAKEKGYKIKLLASVRKTQENAITAFVIPQFIKKEDYLYNVENEYNGVTVEAAFADRQFFMGKGAGGHPTGSAVLSDISASRYQYKYEYKKLAQHHNIRYTTEHQLEVYLRYHDEEDLELLRFTEISEKYSGKNFNYVIGIVSLKHLTHIKAELASRNIFIAATGQKLNQPQELVYNHATAAKELVP